MENQQEILPLDIDFVIADYYEKNKQLETELLKDHCKSLSIPYELILNIVQIPNDFNTKQVCRVIEEEINKYIGGDFKYDN